MLRRPVQIVIFFFFNDTATTEIYTLSLHDALPISTDRGEPEGRRARNRRNRVTSVSGGRVGIVLDWLVSPGMGPHGAVQRSEEHTSELQSPCNLACRLLL